MIAGMLLWFGLSLGLQKEVVQYQVSPPITCEISVNAENDWLHLYGTYENEMEKSYGFLFSPRQDTYTVGASIKFDNIAIYFEHQCSHAVNPLGENPYRYDSSHNKIWLRITSKEMKR